MPRVLVQLSEIKQCLVLLGLFCSQCGVPCFTILDLLFRVLLFRIICSAFRIPDILFYVPDIVIPAFRVLPQPGIYNEVTVKYH